MEDKLNNDSMRSALEIAKAGIDRFYFEGYTKWPKSKFQQLLGPHINLDDQRIRYTLLAWENAGIIQYIDTEDVYICILKPFS
ncbi:MAG: hypothetical protein GY746_01675 [Gammaproteobacteria bacterium]|nr:hypothetical protein [Gammaproteobacteria bacterium]